jgi:hypothetical protein
MIEYSNTQEVVDTIFGMQGTIVGNAWGEQLDSGDRQLGTSTRVGT